MRKYWKAETSARVACHTAGMEGRPPVWIGHAVLSVSDVNRSANFWQEVGMREIERNAHVAVLELRGGTHLVLVPGAPPTDTDAPFDLMVDDLDATNARWKARANSTRRRSNADVSTRRSRYATLMATASRSTARMSSARSEPCRTPRSGSDTSCSRPTT